MKPGKDIRRTATHNDNANNGMRVQGEGGRSPVSPSACRTRASAK